MMRERVKQPNRAHPGLTNYRAGNVVVHNVVVYNVVVVLNLHAKSSGIRDSEIL